MDKNRTRGLRRQRTARIKQAAQRIAIQHYNDWGYWSCESSESDWVRHMEHLHMRNEGKYARCREFRNWDYGWSDLNVLHKHGKHVARAADELADMERGG